MPSTACALQRCAERPGMPYEGTVLQPSASHVLPVTRTYMRSRNLVRDSLDQWY